MAEIQGVILFCDDVREEASGKVTLVGIYGTDFLGEETEVGSVASIVASFNARIRGSQTVRLKFTVEMVDHSKSAGPHITERDFSGAGDEWLLRVNLHIPIIFEPGAVLKVLAEGDEFKTDASLKLGRKNSHASPELSGKETSHASTSE